MDAVLALDTPLPTSGDAPTRDRWRLSHGSHLAVALDRRSIAAPVPVRSGTFDVEPTNGVGTLVIELAGGGSLRGVAERGGTDADGAAVWTVTGKLRIGDRTTAVVLALRDHGVIRRSGAWWWLSGIGVAPRSGRQRCRRYGAALVADLLFTP